MNIMITSLLIALAVFSISTAAAPNTDKTLESWVCLANTIQQGASTLIAATENITTTTRSVTPMIMEATPPRSKTYRGFRKKLIDDRTRPTYHLVNPEGTAMPGDPNGAIYYKGLYHLHYIVNDGGYSYAHVSSNDMVHWRWHPLILTPRFTGHGMFSGTCFLNKEGIPTMIYHGAGSGRNQLAIAADDSLDSWTTPYPIEPKILADQDGSRIAHWDPDCWVDGDTYYAVSGGTPGSGKPPTLMKSRDLRNWEYLGLFMSRDMPDVGKDEDVSCPNFFRIGDKYMLLCISHNKGCRYYLGEWKNEKFTPDFHARMNWSGTDFFAPESLLTPDGRRVMWAWCMGGGNSLWDGIQCLPRELSLPKDGELRIKPLRELEQLRYSPARESDISVEAGKPYRLKDISGDTIGDMATIKQGGAQRYGVKVHAGKDNNNGIDIIVEPKNRTITLGATTAPLELKPGEDIKLRIFIDRRIVEVFANDRQAVFKQHDHGPEDMGVCLFADGGGMRVREVKGWKMAPSNPW